MRSFINSALQRVLTDLRGCGGFLIVLAVYYAVSRLLFRAFCPWVIFTGLPCPGCGMTRALAFFLTGQFARGWEMNPLGICWIVLALYFCIMRYALGKKPKGVPQAGGVIVVCMVILYAYRMYCFFPGDPPISFTGGSLLERTVPGWRELVLKLPTHSAG